LAGGASKGDGPDFDGITTEAPSREALIERLKMIVPDVLESRLGHPSHEVSIVINWQSCALSGRPN
jgi:hypothetical protein